MEISGQIPGDIETDGTEPGALLRAGRLDAAIAAATDSIRRKPDDPGMRILLAELLIFAGKFERADAGLVAAEALDASLALAVAEFRQLLRGAEARRQFHAEGRLPEFIGAPTPHQTALLASLVAARAGDAAAAVREAEKAEAARPVAPGLRNGVAFDDCRDGSDLVGGTLEVLTTTGKFFWIPIERVVQMTLHDAKRPRDLVWRRCSMTVRDGPDGDVYLPALYDDPAPDGASADDLLRLGRATAWTGEAPVRGSGQRVFLVGDEGVALHELGTIEFST